MIIIKKSKTGLGLFTTKNIRKTKETCQIKGQLIHSKKINEIGGNFQNNTFRYSSCYYLSPSGQLGDYLNHSCVPNCKVVKKNKKLYLYALNDINRGDEILLDYSTILAKDDTWKMSCRCGNKSCRKIISKYSNLPKKLLSNYINGGIIPDYIRLLG